MRDGGSATIPNHVDGLRNHRNLSRNQGIMTGITKNYKLFEIQISVNFCKL